MLELLGVESGLSIQTERWQDRISVKFVWIVSEHSDFVRVSTSSYLSNRLTSTLKML